MNYFVLLVIGLGLMFAWAMWDDDQRNGSGGCAV